MMPQFAGTRRHYVALRGCPAARAKISFMTSEVNPESGSGADVSSLISFLKSGGGPQLGSSVDVSSLVGRTTPEAIEAARSMGIETIRVLESVDGVVVTNMTMDLRISRLNLVIEGGVVLSAHFG